MQWAGTPLVAAAAWGTFGSPRAPLHLDGAARLLLEAGFFGSGAVALGAAGHVTAAATFAVMVAANIALLNALGARVKG